MLIEQEPHRRRSIRLRGYDYRQPGMYFLTIVTQHRECLFGEVARGHMIPNAFGEVVSAEWRKSADIREELELDVFVVMPNHVHGIVQIIGRSDRPIDDRGGDKPVAPTSPLMISSTLKPIGPAKHSLGAFIAGVKSVVTKRINELRRTPGTPVWQRNYYEHIVRNQESLAQIREYIVNNPLQWDSDRENPIMVGTTGRSPLHGDEPWRI